MTPTTANPESTSEQASGPLTAPVGSVHVHSDVGVTVNIVTEQSSDTWHKVLDALWDDGIIGSMPDPAFRVLSAFLRLRKREDGIVTVSIPTVTSMVGRSKSYVYEGRAFLLASSHRLLAVRTDLGRDTYHVLPGWSFAGRTFHAGGKPSTVAESPPERFRHGGRLSTLAEKPTPPHREARARSERIGEFVDDEFFAALTRETPANARFGGPFKPADAVGIVEKAEPEILRTAIRNADALGRSGRITSTWRGYIVAQCRNGCTLFPQLAAADDEAQRNLVLVRRLLELDGESDRAAVVRAWWNSMSKTRQAKAITPSERSRSDEWVYAAIVRKASDALRRGSFAMPVGFTAST